MQSNKIHIITLYFIISILIVINIISNKNLILNNSKIILKNMNESTEVTNLNSTIETLNNSHTEYSNYIQSSKTAIAAALTNEGVETSFDDTLETMAANISKILQARTSNATATATNITIGKTAWVNGNLITGTAPVSNNRYKTGSLTSSGSLNVNVGFKPTKVLFFARNISATDEVSFAANINGSSYSTANYVNGMGTTACIHLNDTGFTGNIVMGNCTATVYWFAFE